MFLRDCHDAIMGVPRSTASDCERPRQPFFPDINMATAERGVYFHNGIYRRLKQVMDFHNLRNTGPGKIYPRDVSGKFARYNDIPVKYQANVDVADAPFDRKFGAKLAMTDQDINDTVAFLKTLDDGYKPRG